MVGVLTSFWFLWRDHVDLKKTLEHVLKPLDKISQLYIYTKVHTFKYFWPSIAWF